MEENVKNLERTYIDFESCVFRKTKEAFGGLSNMASGFPIRINDVAILTSEALYQACRFPHLPDVQRKIIEEKSPMSAKMVGKPYRVDTRADWDNTRIQIMYWCLRVKLAQNFQSFGNLLFSSNPKSIVEDSNKDRFWGAVRDKSEHSKLVGVNALGRLLMKLRQEYFSENRLDLLTVSPLAIPNFAIYGNPIQIVDERPRFLDDLMKKWGISNMQDLKAYSFSQSQNRVPSFVQEELINLTGNLETRLKTIPKKQKSTKSKKVVNHTGDLFSDF